MVAIGKLTAAGTPAASGSARRSNPRGARAAWKKWGLDDPAARRRGVPGAYTAEDHERDVRAGRADPVRLRRCPSDHPGRDCLPQEYPDYYRTPIRTFRRIDGRRQPCRDGVLCFECLSWLETRRHQAFVQEVGDETGQDAQARRVTAADVYRALYERAASAMRELVDAASVPIGWSLESMDEWYVISLAAARLRHCERRYQRTIAQRR